MRQFYLFDPNHEKDFNQLHAFGWPEGIKADQQRACIRAAEVVRIAGSVPAFPPNSAVPLRHGRFLVGVARICIDADKRRERKDCSTLATA
jgi:hypothetical protein